MKQIRVLCLILAFILIFVGCEGKLTKSLHAVAADGELEQKEDSPLQPIKRVEKYIYKQTPQGELAMYVHFPPDWSANDKRPAIVFFFGGAWWVGTVNEFTPQAEYLAGRGMVTARADYRVKSRHGTEPDKCVEDGKSAVRWLRANAAKLGIDPNRIAASGHSAGGHIAACTYTTKGLEAEGEDLSVSSKPNLLVFFNTFLDCTGTPDHSYLGSKEMAIKMSPNHNLTQDVPPTILFYGTEDRRHVLDGIDFLKKSKKLGNIAELYTADEQSHNFSKRSPWLERTIYLMDKFLERYGYIQGEPTIKLPEGKVEMKKMSSITLSGADTWGYTPLHRAARHGQKESVELLIANGAEVNAGDRWGWTPLFDAAHYGHKELVELLIDSGADVNAKDRRGDTPLHRAVRNGYKERIELLIAKGADVNAKNNAGQTPIDLAMNQGRKEIAKLLLSKSGDVSLYTAAYIGDLQRVEKFIDDGAGVNTEDHKGQTALHYAAKAGNKEVVELLIKAGADLNCRDKDGQTPASLAMANDHISVVELLVSKGADVSLHLSAYLGDLAKVKSFIESGIDINAKGQFGVTPLYLSLINRLHKDVAELLLDKGANPNTTAKNDATLLHQWAWGGDPANAKSVIEFLIRKGADVNALQGESRWTPLHSACHQGRGSVAKVLIDNGADVNAKTGGQTALSLAKEKGHQEVIELLRKHGAEE